MKKHVAVIGLGRFGTGVARTLAETGYQVLAMDTDEKRVLPLSALLTHAVQADATDKETLKKLGISNFDLAVVAIGTEMQNSMMATLLLKQLGVPFIIARAHNELHGSILERIGADKVVYPEKEMGTHVAHILMPNVVDYMEIGPNEGVIKIISPERLVGRTLSEVGLGRGGRRGISVLMVQRGKESLLNPDRSEVIHSGDLLIVVTSNDRLESFLSEE